MSQKIRWGILSTAKIGVEKVIPAMQRGSSKADLLAAEWPVVSASVFVCEVMTVRW